MKLYHITPGKNIKSIMENGILPGFNKGLTCHHQKWNMVFLTNDIDRIIRDQSGMDWVNKKEAYVIEVEIEDHRIRPHEYNSGSTYSISDFEFTTDMVNNEEIKRYYKYKN